MLHPRPFLLTLNQANHTLYQTTSPGDHAAISLRCCKSAFGGVDALHINGGPISLQCCKSAFGGVDALHINGGPTSAHTGPSGCKHDSAKTRSVVGILSTTPLTCTSLYISSACSGCLPFPNALIKAITESMAWAKQSRTNHGMDRPRRWAPNFHIRLCSTPGTPASQHLCSSLRLSCPLLVYCQTL